MAKKDKYHQKLSSFINPAWCLVPPPPSNTTTRHHKKGSTTRKQQQCRRSPRAAVEEPASPVVGCMGQVRRCKRRPSSGAAKAAGSVRSDSSSSTSRSRSASPPNPTDRLDNTLKPKGFSTLTRVETVDGMDPPRPVEKKEEKERSIARSACGRDGAEEEQRCSCSCNHRWCRFAHDSNIETG
ncbi:hypothetical protein M6B38_182830 [Iris pallida]|uniref:Uncharacterized protein n=1 Tax=Iris pallida TaxID=29817 RepID=A0AAX6EK33_IRIPA|nr:hypothetical protein M6B38_182830 [Iris pallida]